MNNVCHSPAARSVSLPIAFGTTFAICLALAEPALAQSSGAFAPLETAVQIIVDFITGPFGRLLAIIAVIALGFLAFAGRLSWFTAGAVVLGIGLVFGAPAIVDEMIAAVGN
ncbi:TrbC/VirB2 family protein [Mesorhizobium sp. CN2-181]|uniref:TrbC/VirB2 family protein n=1 Tax=Mesorhizobium yinganensis TaxID=3157707 RepID=UPI0032B7FBAF